MTDIARIQATVNKLRALISERHAGTSEDDLNAALQFASRQVDLMFRFRGERVDPTQPMSWPRKNVFDANGQPITDVPEQVQDATYFLAGCRLLGAPFGSHDPSEQRDILTYILLLLEGLLDPNQPMNAPGGGTPRPANG